MEIKKELSPEQREELLRALEARFEKNEILSNVVDRRFKDGVHL
jgi:F0F1-type ATP synthase delta subunit